MADLSDLIVQAGQARERALERGLDLGYKAMINRQQMDRQKELDKRDEEMRQAQMETENLRRTDAMMALQERRDRSLRELNPELYLKMKVEEGALPKEAKLGVVEQDGVKYNAIQVPGREPIFLNPAEAAEARAGARSLRSAQAKADAQMATEQRAEARSKRLIDYRAQKKSEAKPEAFKTSAAGKQEVTQAAQYLMSAPVPGADNTTFGKAALTNPAAKGELATILATEAKTLMDWSNKKGSGVKPLSYQEALSYIANQSLSLGTAPQQKSEVPVVGGLIDFFGGKVYNLDTKAIRAGAIAARNTYLGREGTPESKSESRFAGMSEVDQSIINDIMDSSGGTMSLDEAMKRFDQFNTPAE